MSKKYYYRNPIVALYMMKEFGVGFILEDEEKLRSFLGVGLSEKKETFEKKLRIKSKYFIAKESEHIFEKTTSDIGERIYSGKQFFMAEVENERKNI
ncbi:MAG: hypothetical protein WCJ58_00825 [bacterium]